MEEDLAEIKAGNVDIWHPYVKLKLRLNSEGFIDDEGARFFL